MAKVQPAADALYSQGVVRLPTEPLVGRERELRLARQVMLDVELSFHFKLELTGDAKAGTHDATAAGTITDSAAGGTS